MTPMPMTDIPPDCILLIVEPHADDRSLYRVAWSDNGEAALENIPEDWLDLIPFMAARWLLARRHDASRTLVLRLVGADFEMMRAPLGAVAAPPLVNYAAPVSCAVHCVYHRRGLR